MASALEHRESFLGVMSCGQNNIHRTKINKGAITPGQDIVVCPDKTVMVNKIYDIDKNISMP